MNSKDKPKKKRAPKYFPNNIDRIQKDTFMEMPAEYVFDVVVNYWELPSSVQYLIRAKTNTGKVKEFTYQRSDAARNRVKKLIVEGCTEILLCDDESVVQLETKELDGRELFDLDDNDN
jgi:hypothetical protein